MAQLNTRAKSYNCDLEIGSLACGVVLPARAPHRNKLHTATILTPLYLYVPVTSLLSPCRSSSPTQPLRCLVELYHTSGGGCAVLAPASEVRFGQLQGASGNSKALHHGCSAPIFAFMLG
eukprot:2372311-Amphidinium_carterae.1